MLILGTGGTHSTVTAVCRDGGAKEILTASRTGKGDALLYSEAMHRPDVQIIVNTTPCGMFPNVGQCLIDPKAFPALEAVLDVVYNPFRTELLLYSTLNPSVKHPEGVSILRGTPALSEALMKIYRCIGQNFDRAGNVRYAVTYKPSDDPADKAFAKDRAMEIAKEWSDGMSSAGNGVIKDFVAVGDVQIKVIGADSQIIDTEIPVRQLLEQIICKLSIPPFLLGLNWSTTERMSSQQADILTSELEYYRRLLTPILLKAAQAFLRLSGFSCGCSIEWENINLQDEAELAKANYYNALAQAAQS